MKKIFIMMIMAAIIVGCHKDNITGDTPPVQESNVATYTGKLTLNVGQNVTKSFDENLEWTWKEGDVIIGYQNAGSKHLNKLTFKEGNTFVCDNFVYSTKENADFCFFYPDEDKDSQGYIFPTQDGTWQPVLYGVAPSTTLAQIESVEMTHLTSAIEFKLFRKDKITPLNIQKATLSASLNDSPININYGLKLDDSNTGYSFIIYSGDIAIDMTNNPSNTVVFNVPKTGISDIDIVNYDLTLTLETVAGVTIEKEFKLNTDGIGVQLLQAGYLYEFDVDAVQDIPAVLPSGTTFNNAVKEALGNCTKIVFYAKSSATSQHKIDVNNMPIYLVPDGNILGIHTSADKFQANSSCSYMFYGLNTIKEINFGNAFDASYVNSMRSMFEGCKSLSELNLTIFPPGPIYRSNNIFEEVGNDYTGSNYTMIMVPDGAYEFLHQKINGIMMPGQYIASIGTGSFMIVKVMRPSGDS